MSSLAAQSTRKKAAAVFTEISASFHAGRIKDSRTGASVADMRGMTNDKGGLKAPRPVILHRHLVIIRLLRTVHTLAAVIRTQSAVRATLNYQSMNKQWLSERLEEVLQPQSCPGGSSAAPAFV